MPIFIATLSHKSKGTRRIVFDDDDLHNAKDFACTASAFMGEGYTLTDVAKLTEQDLIVKCYTLTDVAKLTEQDLSGLVMELITL